MGKTSLRLSKKKCHKLEEVLETLFFWQPHVIQWDGSFNPLSSICLPYLMTNMMLHACHLWSAFFLHN